MQTRALVFALLVAAPWAGVALLANGPWQVGLAALWSVLIILWQHYSLRPAAQAARLLRDLHADPGAGGELDDRLLLSGTRRLIDRLQALEHRWVRRHAITGLPIRESLLESIEEHVRLAAQPTLVGTIRFADYKRLAAFDPDAAEAALKAFADRLARTLRSDRPLAHVDRDCFAILFQNADPGAARSEMAALCYAMTAEIEAEGLALIPEIETGAAGYPDDAETATSLLNQALVSLTRTGGPSASRPPGANAADEARERFVIAQGLRLAIERHELELNFQPVMDLACGRMVAAEALLRWRHPQVGLISPARFIPILEDSDLTQAIGLWALNAACKAAKGWHQQGLADLKVAVNLSARQLDDPSLRQAIERTLRRHSLAPHALEIELTETAAAKDAERTRNLFRQLRALGVTIAIDDFGSGYSSLSYLKNLPFDKLKIDREFVRDVHLRRDSQAICRSLLELGRGLGISVLAEGVETEDEVDQLQKLGCTLFQGFYFAKPLSEEAFLRFAVEPVAAARRDARRQYQALEQEMRG